MRGILLWLLGTSLAFFVTAGAFLLLANLGASPRQSDPIPQAPKTGATAPALDLGFAEDRLEMLEKAPGQTLTLYVENTGGEVLPDVDVVLKTAYDVGPAGSRTRQYRANVGRLGPGERKAVDLEVDLSPPAPAGNSDDTEEDRRTLEARASTPGGASSVETAVLP